VYEDVGLFTADRKIGEDVTELFNYLTGYSRQRHWRRLLVAPVGLRDGIIDLIKREADEADGQVLMKMNSLVDEGIIETLYKASQAGTQIDLVVRGICCLRPGVEGLSDNIRVRSLVGRFLEHSRIYRFGSSKRGYDYLIGSADMMPRNLDRRVETLVPVLDPALQQRLEEILEVNLADDVLSWSLRPDGWKKVPTAKLVDAQRVLQELATERARPRFLGSRA